MVFVWAPLLAFIICGGGGGGGISSNSNSSSNSSTSYASAAFVVTWIYVSSNSFFTYKFLNMEHLLPYDSWR